MSDHEALPSEPDRHPLENRPLRDLLAGVLEQSRGLGFLGPGPVQDHLDHAAIFLEAIGPNDHEVLDLGSGGGLPGLALAVWSPSLEMTLVDASTRRCEFLSEAITELGVDDRVAVVCGRAEELGHDPAFRGRFPLVVARSFGAPAVTAECAAGFLSGPGARIVVSEPPSSDPARWPDEGLALLGLQRDGRYQSDVATLQALVSVLPLETRFPRRNGVPGKRPLFG